MGTEAGRDRDRLSIHPRDTSAGAVTLRLEGELDLVTAPALREAITGHAARGRAVVLDLSELEFIDSTGLVLLMESSRDAEHDGWSVALRRELSDPVARLIEVTQTHGLFTWVDGEAGQS